MNNKCKKRGCEKETLNGRKYCNYHQSRKEGKNRVIVKGGLAVVGFIVTVAFKKFLGDSDKS